MYLFFDSETSGLPQDYNAPPSKGPNWPRLVTLAWLVTDADGREIRHHHSVFMPLGWEIEPEAQAIHGYTTERAREIGTYLWPVLSILERTIDDAQAILAHNYVFDRSVVGSEYLRLDRPDPFLPKLSFCTMRSTADILKLPGRRAGSYKWPRLSELHRFLFGKEHDGQHDALADVRACKRCFFELRKRNLLPGIGSELTEPARIGR